MTTNLNGLLEQLGAVYDDAIEGHAIYSVESEALDLQSVSGNVVRGNARIEITEDDAFLFLTPPELAAMGRLWVPSAESAADLLHAIEDAHTRFKNGFAAEVEHLHELGFSVHIEGAVAMGRLRLNTRAIEVSLNSAFELCLLSVDNMDVPPGHRILGDADDFDSRSVRQRLEEKLAELPEQELASNKTELLDIADLSSQLARIDDQSFDEHTGSMAPPHHGAFAPLSTPSAIGSFDYEATEVLAEDGELHTDFSTPKAQKSSQLKTEYPPEDAIDLEIEKGVPEVTMNVERPSPPKRAFPFAELDPRPAKGLPNDDDAEGFDEDDNRTTVLGYSDIDKAPLLAEKKTPPSEPKAALKIAEPDDEAAIAQEFESERTTVLNPNGSSSLSSISSPSLSSGELISDAPNEVDSDLDDESYDALEMEALPGASENLYDFALTEEPNDVSLPEMPPAPEPVESSQDDDRSGDHGATSEGKSRADSVASNELPGELDLAQIAVSAAENAERAPATTAPSDTLEREREATFAMGLGEDKASAEHAKQMYQEPGNATDVDAPRAKREELAADTLVEKTDSSISDLPELTGDKHYRSDELNIDQLSEIPSLDSVIDGGPETNHEQRGSLLSDRDSAFEFPGLAEIVGDGIASGLTGAISLQPDAFRAMHRNAIEEASALEAEALVLEEKAKKLRDDAQKIRVQFNHFSLNNGEVLDDSSFLDAPALDENQPESDKAETRPAESAVSSKVLDPFGSGHLKTHAAEPAPAVPKAIERDDFLDKPLPSMPESQALGDMEEDTLLGGDNVFGSDSLPMAKSSDFHAPHSAMETQIAPMVVPSLARPPAQTFLPQKVTTLGLVVEDPRARGKLHRYLDEIYEHVVDVFSLDDVLRKRVDVDAVVLVRPSPMSETLDQLPRFVDNPIWVVVVSADARFGVKGVDVRIPLGQRASDVSKDIKSALDSLLTTVI